MLFLKTDRMVPNNEILKSWIYLAYKRQRGQEGWEGNGESLHSLHEGSTAYCMNMNSSEL